MNSTDHDRGPLGHTPPAPRVVPQPTLLDQMGGPMGFVYSAVPVVVFVAANSLLPIAATVIVSVAVALAIAGYRLLRGEKLSSAAGGLLGLALAIGIVAVTGSARDFFVVGIWAYLAAFVVTLGSVLARRPLSGVVWNLVHGGAHAWRADRRVLRASTTSRRSPRRRCRVPGSAYSSGSTPATRRAGWGSPGSRWAGR